MLISDCNIPRNTHQKRCVMLDGRVVGEIDGNTFFKSVHASKHQLKSPPAWSIDADIFDKEIKPDCTQILIKDQETGNQYQCSIETFDQFKRNLDRGYGHQYYLTIDRWDIETKGEKQLKLW
jgi:hypothetical protein